MKTRTRKINKVYYKNIPRGTTARKGLDIGFTLRQFCKQQNMLHNGCYPLYRLHGRIPTHLFHLHTIVYKKAFHLTPNRKFLNRTRLSSRIFVFCGFAMFL